MMRQRILLTNDDGYASRRISLLYQTLSPGNDVTIVAPKTEQSGIGHAFTYKRRAPFRSIKRNRHERICGQRYAFRLVSR